MWPTSLTTGKGAATLSKKLEVHQILQDNSTISNLSLLFPYHKYTFWLQVYQGENYLKISWQVPTFSGHHGNSQQN